MSITWFDGVTLTAEAALSSATGSYGAWDAGVWDTATWGPDLIWVDLSARLRSVSTTRAFSRDVQSWDPGSATVTFDNRDRALSPANMSGPYAVNNVTQIRPGRPARITASYNGISYPIYTGYATAWQEYFADAHADGWVVVPCRDELARLADFDGLTIDPALGAGETAGRRVHRILDNAGYTGTRSIESGGATMVATDHSRDALAELNTVADSEGGAVWVDPDGTVVFEGLYALIENTRSNTIRATFGDGSGTELPCADIATAYDGDRIVNIVSMSRDGGTAQTVTDATSRALYQDRRSVRTDLICDTDAWALTLAGYTLARWSTPEYRATQLVIKPRRNPALLFPQVLGRRVRDVIRVIIRPLGGGTITRDCHIAGISHTITKDDWITTFDLASARVPMLYSSSRWDLGTWDSSLWFF